MVVVKSILWSSNSGKKLFYPLKNVPSFNPCKYNGQNSRSFHLSSVRRLILSPQEVTEILRENEFSVDLGNGPVKSYETNQVATNYPMEDYTTEVKCNVTSGFLFGVFDGHGGRSCANVTSRRLFQYLAASLLPEGSLQDYISTNQRPPLIDYFDSKKAKVQFIPQLSNIYSKSFDKYLNALVGYNKDVNGKRPQLNQLIEFAFEQLDKDLSNEFLNNYSTEKKIDQQLLEIAISGSVACIALIKDHHLHIANTGDSCAIMGSLSEDNEWITRKLCLQHTVENTSELNRLHNMHPNEEDTIIKCERLLGQLLPLRAFGDYRYKWHIENLKEIVVPILGNVIPPGYLTPPYVTAKPEIFSYKLTPRDKFVVLATDGLWDVLTPHEVVSLVGEHMLGKASFTPVSFSKRNIDLGEVLEVLEKRQESLENKPIDRNVATHLIRHAFGSTDCGYISNSKLSKLLSMPPKVARRYRDDISITVIYLDNEFLRNQV